MKHNFPKSNLNMSLARIGQEFLKLQVEINFLLFRLID